MALPSKITIFITETSGKHSMQSFLVGLRELFELDIYCRLNTYMSVIRTSSHFLKKQFSGQIPEDTAYSPCLPRNLLTTRTWNFDIQLVLIYTVLFFFFWRLPTRKSRIPGSKNSVREKCLLFYHLCIQGLIWFSTNKFCSSSRVLKPGKLTWNIRGKLEVGIEHKGELYKVYHLHSKRADKWCIINTHPACSHCYPQSHLFGCVTEQVQC